ncbi:MAG: hypothetical protein K1X57_07745 [Gemmataceae bacterium]|nr:hypothetical protein [Gemmataceae bacterium]
MATVLRVGALSLLVFIAGSLRADTTDAQAVRDAMAEAKAAMVRGDSAQAVALLEKQLGRVQGDPTFLAALKEAYQAYLQRLQLDNKFETHELYRKRLAVIDKIVVAQPVAPVKRDIVRGIRPEEDPFQQTPIGDSAKDPCEAASREFATKNYSAARREFDRLREGGVAFGGEQKSQYAYCLLHDSVAAINAGRAPRADIERDIRFAMNLVPQDARLNAFANQVLQELPAGRESPATAPTPGPIAVRHADAGKNWTRSESTNFRLTHSQDRGYAEKFLAAAEQHRLAAFAKWGTATPAAWKTPCEIVLHATGTAYAEATKQSPTAPGHSSIRSAGGKITARRIDLRADNPELANVTMPHEITHIVLGDLFVDAPLPRWADEGMAVLAEPRTQVDRYLKTMIRLRQEGKLVPLAQILGKSEYPDAASVTVFYVESVSVVEFLVNQKGPAEFAAFMRDSSGGLEAALRSHYGINDVATLQDRWLRATFTEIDRAANGG